MPANSLANTNRSLPSQGRFVRRCKASNGFRHDCKLLGPLRGLRRGESTDWGEGFSASSSSDSPSRSRLGRASGRCQASRLAAIACWGPTRMDGVRRWAARGSCPGGELTRLAKAHDLAAAPSGAALGCALPSRWTPPTVAPLPPTRHPPPVAGVGSPTCFPVTAGSRRPCDATDPSPVSDGIRW